MEKVFLAHGLWMSGYVCASWKKAVSKAGMQPVVFSYPSVRPRMDQNAERLFQTIQRHCSGADTIHLVGHSMGGMVIMQMLRRYGHEFAGPLDATLPQLGRVLLCGSPINGSHVAGRINQWPALNRLLGRSILDWYGIERGDLPAGLDIGVLAGTRKFGLGQVVRDLPQPSDGTVSVQETRLKGGETDFMQMNVSHTELLFAPSVNAQMIHFLQKGQFLHRSAA